MAVQTDNEGLLCCKVISIQELQTMITRYLSFGDKRSCALVCHLWNRLFAHLLWKNISLDKNKYRDIKSQLRHGCSIENLALFDFNNNLLDLVGLSCRNIKSLSLDFLEDSLWVDYCTFETFLFRTNNYLTSVSIFMDVSSSNPALLWTLCLLPALSDLELKIIGPNESKDKFFFEICQGILSYCPSLWTLRLYYYIKQELVAQRSVWSWLKQRVKTHMDTIPSTAQEAFSRVALHNIKSMDQPLENSFSARALQTQKYNIRTLCLSKCASDLKVFKNMAWFSPWLQRLELTHQNESWTLSQWQQLSSLCPNLESLSITLSHPIILTGLLYELIGHLAHLKSFTIISTSVVDLEPWTLESLLELHQRRHGKPHPLKILHIIGDVDHPLDQLLKFLSIKHFAIKTLIVGHKSPFTFGINGGVRHITPETHFYRPWITCADTLTQLDVSMVAFSNDETMVRFFNRLGELSALVDFRLSVFHVKVLVVYASGSGSESYINWTDESSLTLPETRSRDIPRILTVRKVHIRRSEQNIVAQYLDLNDTLAVVSLAPMVEYVEGVGSLVEEVVSRVQAQYPAVLFAVEDHIYPPFFLVV